jgi:tetratricopeptide (TPR) repeat protein
MAQLRKLRDLGEQRISASSIRDSIHAMRSVSGMDDPMMEAGLGSSGSRVVFRHMGVIMEPIAGQFLLDFEGQGTAPMSVVTAPCKSHAQRDLEVARIFAQAVRAEEAGQQEEAIRGYEEILELHPGHAAACINLGTLFYNQGQFQKAEHLYRMATESDPEYALAFFDLGNVLDELKRVAESIVAYERAVALAPKYADAHYNLALALERSGSRRLALRHWALYLKLDGTGPWADHARSQMRRTLARDGLKIVHRAQAQERIGRTGASRLSVAPSSDPE